MDLILYHNPRCSKSREALALLTARGLTPTVIEYLRTPLDHAALRALLGKLGVPARALLREKEAAYAALGLDAIEDDARLVDALVAHPELLERPILVHGERAVIARPPSRVAELLP
jgi:arsenate reductase